MVPFQDSAATESAHRRFVERVLMGEVVFALKNDRGVVNSASNENPDVDVLPFWSDRAYAVRASEAFGDHFDVMEISLFDFLYRWLPGMSEDGVLAGPNWDGNLIGKEVDPFRLREQLEGALPVEMAAKYEIRYKELTGDAQ